MLADNKALVRRLFEEVWNQGNLAAIDELFATSYIRYDPAAPEAKGLVGFKHFVVTLRTAFPDIYFTLEDLIAEGDKVVARAIWRGTHQGEYLGIAPTGKQVAVAGTVTLHVAHDKFQEGWLNMDTLGLLQQLGAIPPLGQTIQ
jgi:predicted ester cyclase